MGSWVESKCIKLVSQGLRLFLPKLPINARPSYPARMDLPHDPAALPAHWQAHLEPLRGDRWPIRCGREFSRRELALLRQGLWPRDMDDRWAVWLGPDDVLRCWRSWTQTCVYEAPLSPEADGGARCPVVQVMDNPMRYQRSASGTSELERFEGVLARVLCFDQA